ncbi:hypothetical protein NLJ89_g12440 [Agrocybe chaxingu]|uniref:Uncharacterized protein n=1 Tax=Agrocybe chaxingu TaxID=84603 RepID=A0A9W8JQH7_9AGAR|nr:hypothetical protein NLJ89_g12440 [Agrocybe chaxingu]
MAVNGHLRDAQSSLRADAITKAYDGLLMATSTVATPAALAVLTNFIHASLSKGTGFEVSLPASTSYIKILDIPYFDPKSGEKITQDALEKVLRTSARAEVVLRTI